MKERGGSKLKTLIALVAIAAVLIGVVRIVPVYVDAYNYEDSIRTQAKMYSVDRKPLDKVREELYQKAQELKLPITREQIQVSNAPGGIAIHSSFAVPVNLIVYQHTLRFDFSADTHSAY
ncbi:MAG: hypothetical protein ACRD35_07970 [Candidatus Acidiferrales bacterium]